MTTCAARTWARWGGCSCHLSWAMLDSGTKCRRSASDAYIANSREVARRISKYYRRPSTVINPPVDVPTIDVAPAIDDYFLVVSRLVPYKRLDVVIDAFNQLGLPLKVVGRGPAARRIGSAWPGRISSSWAPWTSRATPAVCALPGADLAGSRRLRHRAGGSAGVGPPGHRLCRGRRAGDGRARRDRALLPSADAGGADRRRAELRRRALRPGSASAATPSSTTSACSSAAWPSLSTRR